MIETYRRWCQLNQMQWFYSVAKVQGNPLVWSTETSVLCPGERICEFKGEPGTQMRVYTSFWISDERRHVTGDSIIASFCSDSLPPAPKEVNCSWRNGSVNLSWRHEPDVCHSYAYYMVRLKLSGMGSAGGWSWIGEVPPGGGRGGDDADSVRPCLDQPQRLCLNITNSFRVTKLQLGVVRFATDISDDLISKAKPVDCLMDENFHQLPSNTTSSSASSAQTTMPCSPKRTIKPWRPVALVLLAVVLGMIVLLPLTFFAGMRWQKMRNSRSMLSTSCASWQHLNGNNQLDWNRTLGRQGLICNEAPPDYNYDYTYSGLMRNQALAAGQQRSYPTVPLPPPPQEQATEIENDLYNAGTPCEPEFNTTKIPSECSVTLVKRE